jgi:fission 1 protein
MDRLPTLNEAYEPVDASQLAFLQTSCNSQPNAQNTFNYAWALLRSTHRHHIQSSIQVFEEMSSKYPARATECLYFLALAEYKLGNYQVSRGSL